MIITKIIGGIGNQLFQYAVARQLSKINNTKLFLDVSGFDNFKLHKYSLSFFNIKENFYSPTKSYLVNNKYNLFLKNMFSLKKSYLMSIKEKNLKFDPKILTLPKNSYLDGYWQSEKYFISISEIIKKEFKLEIKLSKKSELILNDIKKTDSVSIHFRRTDYLENNIHGACSLLYYRECIKFITRNLHKPHFFLFSDDIKWVKKNIKLKHKNTVVYDNGLNGDIEDLKLMSKCKHNIIANSTFSWWAAWLNNNPEKIITAPKIWFSDEKYNSQSTDIVPSSWLRF